MVFSVLQLQESKKSMITLFFRNDDPDVFYYGDKRDMLYRLTDVFVERKVPIVQAIVPGMVSNRTVEYFNRIDEQSNILEFIQHGWKHSKYNLGEFDKSRTYKQQLDDIGRGKQQMYDFFDNKFFLAFTAPYGAYTKNTFNVLSKEKFRVLSSGVAFTQERRYFDGLGRLFNKPFLFGKRVSYHGRRLAKYDFVELSTSINIIRRMSPPEMLTKTEILERISSATAFTNHIGILLHHIFLSKNDCNMIGSLIDELKIRGFSFSNLSSIYERILQ